MSVSSGGNDLTRHAALHSTGNDALIKDSHLLPQLIQQHNAVGIAIPTG